VGRGTFTIESQSNTIVGQVDGKTLVDGTRQGTVTGALSGTYTEDIAIVIHATGALTFTGTDTCICTVANKSGTVTAHFTGTGVFRPLVDIDQGHSTIVGGTDGLMNLEGEGTFQRRGATGSYTLRYRFDT
jgi:hypothetical protein